MRLVCTSGTYMGTFDLLTSKVIWCTCLFSENTMFKSLLLLRLRWLFYISFHANFFTAASFDSPYKKDASGNFEI